MSTFQLESLPYQTDAVEAVVRVFEGTPKAAAYEQVGNQCQLSWDQYSTNLQAIAQRHRISDEQLNPTEPTHHLAVDRGLRLEQIHHRGAHSGHSSLIQGCVLWPCSETFPVQRANSPNFALTCDRSISK